MKDLGIYVLSWNRPHFLVQTIESLKEVLARDTIEADIYIVDNGSEEETVEIIHGIDGVEKILHTENLGICGGYQAAVPPNVDELYRYILTSDHDILYLEPLSTYMKMLEVNPLCWMAKGNHAPAHKAHETYTLDGREWLAKKTASGGTAVMRTADWNLKLRPLKCPNCKSTKNCTYDWHIIHTMHAVDDDFSFYVLPGTALHTGWRKGDSTWQPHKEIPGDQYNGEPGY